MTPEEQRIAIAKVCGWKEPFQKEWLREYGMEGEDVWAFSGTDVDGERSPLPDYFNDLNACHEMEKSLTDEQYFNYCRNWLPLIQRAEMAQGRTATARQRCEAFLETLGLWREK